MSVTPVQSSSVVVPVAPPQQGVLPPLKPIPAAVSAIEKTATKLPSQEQLREMELEIKLIQEGIKARTNRFCWTSVDLDNDRFLIRDLAVKVAAILKEVFDQLYATVKTRPMTLDEEQKLAGVALRLQKAYTLAGANELAAQAGSDALAATKRAGTKKERAAKLKGLREQIEKFKAWVKTSRHDALRRLPIVNWFAWTTQQVKLNMAQKEVQIIEAELPDVRSYPELLKERIAALGEAKKALAVLQTPNTKEYLKTRREVRELSEEVQRLAALAIATKTLEIATKKVQKAEALIISAAVNPIAANFSATMRAYYGLLLKAKENLAKEYAASSPEANKLQNEIKALNSIIAKFSWMDHRY